MAPFGYRYSVPQKIFLYDSYLRTQSACVVRALFQKKFPDVQVPGRTTIHRLVNKLRETGSLLHKKRKKSRTVLTEETLDNIDHALQMCPNKSLRRLSQQMDISYGSVCTAAKLLRFKSHKITVVQELKPDDAALRTPSGECIFNQDKLAVSSQHNSESNDADNIPSSQFETVTHQDSVFSLENAAGTEETEEEPMEVANSPTAVAELVNSLDEQTLSKEQLSEVAEKVLIEGLSQVSDTGLCHICSLICMLSTQEQNKLCVLITRHLLLPRLQVRYKEPCSRVVSEAIINFVKIFPHVSSSDILLPLMSAPDTACGDLLLQIMKEALTPQQREEFLRNFLQNGPEYLYEWQLSLLHQLLDSTSRKDILQLVIQRMSSSCERHNRNIYFAKLLVHVIQLVGSTASKDIYEHLTNIVSSNKSVLKKAAEKALQSMD